jgi:hypothetical protein
MAAGVEDRKRADDNGQRLLRCLGRVRLALPGKHTGDVDLERHLLDAAAGQRPQCDGAAAARDLEIDIGCRRLRPQRRRQPAVGHEWQHARQSRDQKGSAPHV